MPANNPSPITGNEMTEVFTIKGVKYFKDETNSLFAGCLNQEGMVGGTGDRRDDHQSRIKTIEGAGKILDYGCGKGDFVEFMRNGGMDADGYDPFSLKYNAEPTGKYGAVTMIEVIEHTCAPFGELDHIRSFLEDDGVLIIESSFSDWVSEGDPYLDPSIGHSSIFSHQGLTMLLEQKGFTEGKHVNRNVRIFKKLP